MSFTLWRFRLNPLIHIHQLRQNTVILPVVLSNLQIPFFSLNYRDTWSSSALIYRNSTAFFSGFSSFCCGNISLCSLFLTVCLLCSPGQSGLFLPLLSGMRSQPPQQFCFSIFCQPLMAFYPYDPVQQISTFSSLFIPEQCLFKTNGPKTYCQLFPICSYHYTVTENLVTIF